MDKQQLNAARIAYSHALHQIIKSMLDNGMDTTEIWCELEITLASVEQIAEGITNDG